jgi:flagellar hook-basal body complex protein FliE
MIATAKLADSIMNSDFDSALQGNEAAGNAAAAQEQPFSGALSAFVKEANGLDTQATQAVSGLLNGQGVDVHTAMIATQKADMAFELALQLRNKAVGAYQQMLNMQF